MSSSPSLVHRILNYRPGELPRWLLSPSRCESVDAIGGLYVALVICCAASFDSTALFWCLIAGVIAILEAALFSPARDCERRARARTRSSGVQRR